MTDSSYGKLTALLRLSKRLAEESSATLFTDALALLIEASGAKCGTILLEQGGLVGVAERGCDEGHAPGEVRETLKRLGGEALVRHHPHLVADVWRRVPPIPGVSALQELGVSSVLVAPIEQRRDALGAIVLLAESDAAFDPAALAFVEAAALSLALAIHRDRGALGERVRREELEEANRMASLGLLTASVAHELRGPVGALVLQLEEQQRLLDGATQRNPESARPPSLLSELTELTADIGTALGRVRGTIDQLSRLSRRDSEPEALDLADVVQESLAVARPYLKRRGIELQEDLTEARVTGRRDNLGQVLLNLVFNAADACELSHGERKIMVSVAPDRDQVVLQVDDTGPGIPPNAIKTIFTPFYTTKQRGKGTGLGLKICSDVVTAHGGHIEVVNRPSGGASFRVMLPSLAVRAPSDRPERKAAHHPLRQLMVIDDDPVFTRTVRRGLKELDVRTAPTASDAEMTLAAASYRPDLVLCDVFLPGLNGNVLHARVKKRDPELASRFVFVTGGALSKEEADYLRASGCPTLFKPLNLDDIRRLLEMESEDPKQPLRTLAGALDRVG